MLADWQVAHGQAHATHRLLADSTYPREQVIQAAGLTAEQLAHPGSHTAGYTILLTVTAIWPVDILYVIQPLALHS